MELSIQRLAHQMLENNKDMANTVIIGLQPRGIFMSDRIVAALKEIIPNHPFHYGKLDITFYRDDVRKTLHIANETDIPFSIEGKSVILVDDVLYTGRSIRSALTAIQSFGRPAEIELLVLIDRRFSRHLPIQPDYRGRQVDAINNEKVIVSWQEPENEDAVYLVTN